MKNKNLSFTMFGILFVLAIILFIVAIVIGNIALILIGVVALIVSVVFFTVSLGSTKTTQNITGNILDFGKSQGLNFKTYFCKKPFMLMVDEEKNKFVVDYSGTIYNFDEIHSFEVYSPTYTSVSAQYIQVYLWNQQLKQMKVIYLGERKLQIDKSSAIFREREESIKELSKILDKICRKSREELYRDNDIEPTREFHYLGQYLAVDKVNKKVAATVSGVDLFFDTEDYISSKIVRDNETIATFNVGNAIIGGLIGGGHGAAYWGKDTKKRCNQIYVSVKFYSKNTRETTELQYNILNAHVGTDSALYSDAVRVAENLIDMCKYISKKSS